MLAANNEFERAVAVCRQALIPVAVFSFFINLLMLAMPLYVMQVYDRVISGQSLETLVFLSAITVAAYRLSSCRPTSGRWRVRGRG